MKNDDSILKKLDHYCELFDNYQSLFTEKQCEYFKDYYFYDLSLSEIANNYSISRSAVYDVISKMQIQLDEYEEKLGLVKTKQELNKTLDSYEEKANSENNKLAKDLIENLRKGI